MNRPQPKELVIRHIAWTNILIISVSTVDAKRWIDKEGFVFGHQTQWSHDACRLYVNETYDTTDVVAWLNTYNK